jgi:hypothetical protein
MTTPTSIQTGELFDRELVDRQPLQDEWQSGDHSLDYEQRRRYTRTPAEPIQRRDAKADRRRLTARAFAAGAVIAAIAAGGTWLIVDNASAGGSTQSGAALIQPSAPAANRTIPSGNNTGNMGTGTGRTIPSGNNTGNMGTGPGSSGPSGNNTGNMGTGTGNSGPSGNNTGNMGTGTGTGNGNSIPSGNNTGNMGTGPAGSGPSINNTGQMGTGAGNAS